MLVLIAVSRLHKSVITMTAGVVFLTSRYVSISDISKLSIINLDFILILLGMSIFASFMKRSGMFQFMVLKAVRMSGWSMKKLIINISVIIVMLSALFCDRASVTLIFPIVAFIFDALNVEFNPVLLGILNSASIGGVLLTISGIEVMLVSTVANIGFLDYLINITPAILVSFIIQLVVLNYFHVKGDVDTSTVSMIKFNEEMALRGPNIFSKLMFIMVATLFLLGFSGIIGISDSAIVLTGSVLLFLMIDIPPDQILSDIKLNMFFYIIGLQIVAVAFTKFHIYETASLSILSYFDGHGFLLSLIILFTGSLLSIFFGRLSMTFFYVPLILCMPASQVNVFPLYAAFIMSMTFARAPTMLREIPKVLKNTHIEEKNVWNHYTNFLKDSSIVYLLNFIWLAIYIYTNQVLTSRK